MFKNTCTTFLNVPSFVASVLAMDDDTFESAKLWLAQAADDIKQLQTAQLEAGSKLVFTQFERVVDGKKYWGQKLTSKPPEILRTKVATALNSLRSALDQATWQAAIQLGSDDSSDIYFPFAGNKRAFDDCFKENGRAKNIPAALHSFLAALEAYPTNPAYAGGNTVLYCLSKLSNPNKHKITNKISVDFLPSAKINNFNSTGGNIYQWPTPPQWDAKHGELIVCVTDPSAKVTYDIHMLPEIAFGDVPLVGGTPTLAILMQLASIGERVVLGIEAETRRLLETRA